MSDAERLQKEINYLSVLIRKHKEGNGPQRVQPRISASKYSWSSQRPEKTRNGFSVEEKNPPYVHNPMQRGGKRHFQHHRASSWSDLSPKKVVRRNTPPTSATVAKKTGVTFDSKFKWTKKPPAPQNTVAPQSTVVMTRIQSTPRTSGSSISSQALSTVTKNASAVVPLNPSHPVRKQTFKLVARNSKYKYHKAATSSSPSPPVTQSNPPVGYHSSRTRHTLSRRKSASRWAAKMPVSNPYKLNRLNRRSGSSARRTHPSRPSRGLLVIRRKSVKVGRAGEKRRSLGNNSTHITLSRVALEGLLQKHSVTLKQVLAKKALAKSHETTRFKKHEKKRQHCLYYGRFGKCMRGDSCKFIHDPSRIAVCTRFLRGTCRDEKCSFSHKVSPEKIPVCLFFLRGKCSEPNCPYLHVFLGKDAPICKRFATSGYCPDADKCKMLHIKCCPEYYETGRCPKGKACELPHFGISKFRAKKQAQTDEKEGKEKQKNVAGSDIKEEQQVLAPTSSSSCPDFLSLTVTSPQPINKPFQREPILTKPRFGKLLRQSTSSQQ